MNRPLPYLHPFLFASYPVLALFAANSGQIEASAVLRSWLFSLVLAGVMLVLFRRLSKSAERAALLASLTLVVFFTYGHLYAALKQQGPAFADLVRHRYFLPLVLLLLAAALWQIERSHSPGRLQRLFTAAGILLIAQPVLAYMRFEMEAAQLARGVSAVAADCTLPRDTGASPPDVYLIIMDAYERDDVLLEMHGFDNTPFIRSLEVLGFYVARGSLSNYRHTEMSLSSLLNLDYIQHLPGAYAEDSDNVLGLVELIRHSRLRGELECLGYSTVAVETGVVWTEWRDADYFISRDAGVLHELQFLGGLTRFESLLLRTTLLRAFFDLSTRLLAADQALSNDSLDQHRERVLYEFDELNRIPSLPGPKLVFVHILSPHPPFVFGPNGEAVNHAEFETVSGGESRLLSAYADQVQFLNARLLEAVHTIQSGSPRPPVVIIQGDHGWADRSPEDKHAILNAYYFPDGDYLALYPTITPVNSFRVVLNQYFGGGFELLEDASYFSTGEDIFQFELVANSWRMAETDQ